ncbi:MAG: aspartyl protease family protein [Acidobacteriota bacterium]|nr:MAG: aspartyl protease family protein [Acidobacteriota bacterium]
MKAPGCVSTRLLLHLTSFIFIAQASAAGFDSSQITGTVPFRMHEHLIVVQGSVGGFRDLNLVVDTGSTFTVLSKRVAKKLKLKGTPVTVSAFGEKVTIEKAFLPELALGEVTFEQIEVRICQLPDVDGLRIDALIGMDLLRRTSQTFDFEKGNLVLGQTRELRYNTQFYRGLGFVPVTMTVQGQALRLMLDTGACGLVLYADAIQDRFQTRRSRRIEYRSYVGGRTRMEKITLPDVSLGDSLWEELPAYLIDRQKSGNEHAMGNLGVVALGLKTLQLDFEKGHLAWEFQ